MSAVADRRSSAARRPSSAARPHGQARRPSDASAVLRIEASRTRPRWLDVREPRRRRRSRRTCVADPKLLQSGAPSATQRPSRTTWTTSSTCSVRGCVNVRHGTSAKGLAGHSYPPGPRVTPDTQGEWLAGGLSSGNLGEAQRIWQLVDPGYVPIDWQLDFKSGWRWSRANLVPRHHVRDDAGRRHQGAVGARRGCSTSRSSRWRASLGRSAGSTAFAPEPLCPRVPQRGARLHRHEPAAVRGQLGAPQWTWRIRVANWLVAYDLFRAAGATFDAAFEATLLVGASSSRRATSRTIWSGIRRSAATTTWRTSWGCCSWPRICHPSRETDGWLAFAIQRADRGRRTPVPRGRGRTSRPRPPITGCRPRWSRSLSG